MPPVETILNPEIFTTLIHQASLFGAIGAWIAVFSFGENGAVAVFALASQDLMAPVPTFLWAALGSFSADVFWYGVAKIRFRRARDLPISEKKHPLPMDVVDRFLKTHPFTTMICIKFLMGMRIFLTLYISHKSFFTFRRYLFLNALGTLVFMGVLFPIGWLLGKGIITTDSPLHTITSLFTLIIVIMIFSRIFPHAIRWFLKKSHV